MEVETRHLCIGCMSELNSDGTCPECGLIQKDYAPIPRCLVPGTILENRYYLGKVIGEGAFGITYIGWDSRLAIPVAVKEYYPSDLVSRDLVRGSDTNVYFFEKEGQETYQQQLKQFLDEARNLSRFNQVSGIVAVRDFFYANNTAYIVMDYVKGDSLKSFIKNNGPLSGSDALRMMKPVMEALSKVHAIGLIHRDISPDNILMDENGELILVDFGAARMKNSELTRSMTVVFKRGYSPEEQYRARGKQSPATDVYSICATMYFMMTGKAPEEAIQRLLEDKTVPLEQFSVGLSMTQIDAITKGMAVQAKDRYQTLQDLMDVLYENQEKSTGHKKQSKKMVPIIVAILVVALIVILLQFWKVPAINDRKEDVKNTSELTTQSQTTEVSTDIKTDTKTESTTEELSEDVVMVSLVGLTKKEAMERLDAIKGVTFDVTWKKVYDDTVTKNHIISQNITEGMVFKSNQNIALELVVSKGAKPVTTEAATTVPTQQNQSTKTTTPKSNTSKNTSKSTSKDTSKIGFDGALD